MGTAVESSILSSLRTYRKTALISAVQISDKNRRQLAELVNATGGKARIWEGHFQIKTLESNDDYHTAGENDFLARNPGGEYYFVKPDTMADTYEEVE